MFNKYPYTDFHELNLDWILMQMKKFHEEWNEYQALNHITFSGIWNITKQYPAWTIVNDNNVGYISLKPVPAGISITNTGYWAVVVDYTALIAEIQNRIIALETLTDRLANRKFIIVGDSYVQTSDYAAKLLANLGLDNTMASLNYVCKVNSDASGYIVARGGEGFTNHGNGPDPDANGFLIILGDSENVIDNKDEITDIVVLGGANDSFWDVYDSYVYTNMNAFATYVKATYPNAKLWCGFIARIRGTNPSNITSKNLIGAYYNYSNNPNFTYMHGVEFSLYPADNMLAADNMHPTAVGGDNIAVKAAQVLLYGNAVTAWTNQDHPKFVAFDAAVGSSVSGITLKPIIVDGTHWHVDLPAFDWKPVNNTLNGEFDVIIGTQNAFYLNQPYSVNIPASVMLLAGGGIHTINMNMVFDGYDVHLKGRLDENASSWTSHTNINNILGFEVSFDIQKNRFPFVHIAQMSVDLYGQALTTE